MMRAKPVVAAVAKRAPRAAPSRQQERAAMGACAGFVVGGLAWPFVSPLDQADSQVVHTLGVAAAMVISAGAGAMIAEAPIVLAPLGAIVFNGYLAKKACLYKGWRSELPQRRDTHV
jgi:CHASE2 domain-containing sensor protein